MNTLNDGYDYKSYLYANWVGAKVTLGDVILTIVKIESALQGKEFERIGAQLF